MSTYFGGVLFISDMYLPIEFLQDVLKEKGFFKEGDQIFVSSEIGLTKASGRLYDYAQQQCHLSFHSWCHRGDNQDSDYKMAKKKGIHAIFVNHQYTFSEKILKSKDISSWSMNGWMMAGLSRSIRLQAEKSSYHAFATDCIAPIFVPFVYHVMQDAVQRKIEKLFFVARDGYIFFQIAQIFQDVFPQLQLKYIRLSRKSLYLPGVRAITHEEFRRVFIDSNTTVQEGLDRMQMNEFKLSGIDRNAVFTDQMIDELLADQNFVAAFQKKQREQKELCLEYFRNEGLGSANCAIVDMRGARNCQRFLNNILKDAGLKPAFGYYFEVTDRRVNGTDYHAQVFSEVEGYKPVNVTLSPSDLFEQYFCATDQKRTASYQEDDGKVIPVFEDDHLKMDYRKKISTDNIRACLDFAEEYKRFPHHDAQRDCELGLAAWSYFYHVPDKKTLEIFKDLVFTSSSFIHYPLLNKKPFWKCILKRGYSMWPIADLVYNTPRGLNRIVRFMLNLKYFFTKELS